MVGLIAIRVLQMSNVDMATVALSPIMHTHLNQLSGTDIQPHMPSSSPPAVPAVPALQSNKPRFDSTSIPKSNKGGHVAVDDRGMIPSEASTLACIAAMSCPPKQQMIDDGKDGVANDAHAVVEINGVRHWRIGAESHTFSSVPSGADPRDNAMLQFEVAQCAHGAGELVMGQDARMLDEGPDVAESHVARNSKFVCDIERFGKEGHPCVIYSFGSWDEISFEVGLHSLAPQCEVHTFDPMKFPDATSAKRYNFTVHNYGIGLANQDKPIRTKTLQTIMTELGHSYVDYFKLDIEGNEDVLFQSWHTAGLLAKMGQIAPEYHTVAAVGKGTATAVSAGFKMVFGCKEDRCGVCTEVVMQRTLVH